MFIKVNISGKMRVSFPPAFKGKCRQKDSVQLDYGNVPKTGKLLLLPMPNIGATT